MAQIGPFTFDPVSGELTGEGRALRLPPQQAQLLALLVEARGTLVTRDMLRARIWPDTTVEFDQGLNFCIRQLRLALGDDAANPTFIETLPRRGYRLRAETLGAELLGAATLGLETGDTAAVVAATVAEPVARGRRRPLLLTLGVLVIALAVWWARRPPSAPARPILAIVPFDVDSPTPSLMTYRDRLAESLVERITQATLGQLQVLGPASTSAFGSRSHPDSIRAHTGAAFVLSGVVRAHEPGIALFAQLIRTRDGAHLWAARPVDSTATLMNGDGVAAPVMALLLGGAADTMRPVRRR